MPELRLAGCTLWSILEAAGAAEVMLLVARGPKLHPLQRLKSLRDYCHSVAALEGTRISHLRMWLPPELLVSPRTSRNSHYHIRILHETADTRMATSGAALDSPFPSQSAHYEREMCGAMEYIESSQHTFTR